MSKRNLELMDARNEQAKKAKTPPPPKPEFIQLTDRQALMLQEHNRAVDVARERMVAAQQSLNSAAAMILAGAGIEEGELVRITDEKPPRLEVVVKRRVK